MKKKIFLLFILAGTPLSCIKEIQINIKEDNTGYIIYAQLDREETTFSVQISPFTPLYKPLAFDLKKNPNPQIVLYQSTPNGTISPVADNFKWNQEASNKDNGFIFEAPVGALHIRNRYWIEITFPDGTVITSEKERFPTKVPIDNVSYNKVDGFYRIQFKDPQAEDNYYGITAEIVLENPDGSFEETNNLPNEFLQRVVDDTVFDGNTNAEINIEIYDVSLDRKKYIEGSLIMLTKTGYLFLSKRNEIYFQTDNYEASFIQQTDPFLHLFKVPLSNLKSNLFNQNQERVVGAFLLTQSSYAPAIPFED